MSCPDLQVTDKCQEHGLSSLMTIEAAKYKKQVGAL